MKIQDNTPSAATAGAGQSQDQPAVAQSGKLSPFAQALAKKAGKAGALAGDGEDTGNPSLNSDPLGGFFQTNPIVQQPGSIQPEQVAAVHAVTLPPELQNVVREICVGVNAAGNQQVQIELNSTALRGLQIKIEKHDGQLGIQFLSSSDNVTRLLSRNVDALSSALAERGLVVNEIQVTPRAEVPRVQEYSKSGRREDSGRGQGGGGQGRQQQRGRQ